jgi:uroporphyrinogen-III synthase
MRVLVTRSPEDAERTARRLAVRGHEALIAPVIRIAPTGEPQPEGPFDAFVITSAHAARALSAVAAKQAPVFAVGLHTANAVREAGFSFVVAASGDARSLSASIRDGLVPGATLLHVTGRHRKNEPAASLLAAGFQMRQWQAYEAQAVESLPASAIDALRTGRIGAALHYSRRSADLFLRLTSAAGLTSELEALSHLCLSADAAAPFASLGITTLSAAQPDEDALLALLDDLP